MLNETVDDSQNERKAAALDLAAGGFYVLPVDPKDKRPDRLLAPNGFKDATRNAEVIGGWFDAKPKCNIGIACGTDYDLVVLDVDVKNGARGLATLNDLWVTTTSPTLTANTPSGGLHLYYKHPRRKLRAKLDGIDIKGADGGGYVLAPPSQLPSGAYTWRDAEIPVADFPPFLLEELQAAKSHAAEAVPASSGPVASIKVHEGSRHARLLELAGALRAKALTAEEIEVLLWHHAVENFSPPFNRGNAEEAKEVEDLARWVGGKEAPEQSVDTSLVVVSSAELIARADALPDRCLLDPILPEAGNLMIHGITGVGKSHLGLSIALALASGGTLLDWTTTEPVTVLYCDGEMPLPELKSRLQQYLAGAVAPERLLWAAARLQTADMPDLANPAAQARYLAALEQHGARCAVFDNLSCLRQTSTDNPENSVEAWQPVAAFIRRLNALGIGTVTVHHSAKSGTQRGSSAHTAVMDTVLCMRPATGQDADTNAELDVEIVFEKHRRFGGAATVPLRARVTLDVDDFATWSALSVDPLVDSVIPLRLAGKSVREIGETLRASKSAVHRAISRAKARGKLPLTGGAD